MNLANLQIKKIKARLRNFMIFSAFLACLMAVFIFYFCHDILFALLIPLAAVIYAYSIFKGRIFDNLDIKGEFLSVVSSRSSLNLSHIKKETFTKEEFCAPSIYPKEFEHFNANLAISGLAHGTGLKFGDVCAQKLTEQNLYELFYGTLFIIKFSHKAAHQITVIDQKCPKTSNLNQNQAIKKIDDLVFYCNDKEANSPFIKSFIAHFVKLKNQLNYPLNAEFDGETLKLFLHKGKDSFCITLQTTLNEQNEQFEAIKEELDAVSEFIKAQILI